MPTSFGDLERAVLDVLWETTPNPTPGSTVREVHGALVGRDIAYTTVMTVLDRLARKEQILQRQATAAPTLYRARARAAAR